MCSCHSILECCVTFSGVKLSIRSFVLFGRKFNFFSPLGFEAKSGFDHKTSNESKVRLKQSLKRYLKTIVQFMVDKQHRFFDLVQNFESDFRSVKHQV